MEELEPKEVLEMHRDKFIADHNECCLCGTTLKFEHVVDHLENEIEEKAKCPDCHIQLRTKKFKIQ